jgi:7,8-dihydroneopterin aldolase/epimerase/oxygenase
MTDRIEIRALRVVAHVGVGADERALAQPLELDIDLEVALDVAAGSDDVADTVDYGAVAVAVAAAVQGAEHALLERVAAVAADAALAVDESTSAVTVAVRKLRPPIPLDVGSTGVRLRRARR